MERLLSPLQSEATSGAGKTLIVPDPERIVGFLIQMAGRDRRPRRKRGVDPDFRCAAIRRAVVQRAECNQ
jgi:hypothetical protein